MGSILGARMQAVHAPHTRQAQTFGYLVLVLTSSNGKDAGREKGESASGSHSTHNSNMRKSHETEQGMYCGGGGGSGSGGGEVCKSRIQPGRRQGKTGQGSQAEKRADGRLGRLINNGTITHHYTVDTTKPLLPNCHQTLPS
ncbi:hypothetical protein BU24DRAFT_409290 [Aaosphaeria arxii CBS 175.79]|uniref:Uncharacterized protein n=1 Tax=Aaosphaeria arxii CBS 175.79 TaxID=1450172 RepID=A0A6A5XV64_9PLEO|nr:uncharacterized protein BU24DRAFT_409290 [Aaosphaeria arxii CBS 175.79]KAF2016144.1 hypothetical protein BU24DRAFT_409290 [Aaosphaeria arxii CBS 175.79]